MLQVLTENAPMLISGTFETLYMTLVSTAFSYIFGLPLGIIVYLSRDNGIRPNKAVNRCLGWVINIFRSIPFMILIVALSPFTVFVAGTSIGPSAAIVPMVIGATPFVARMVESSLEEMDTGIIEAAKTMGASDMQIILKVLIPESIPSLVRGASITTITLVGFSAMAGVVGGKGLGDIAIRYGLHRFQSDIMYTTVIIIVIIVQLIQSIFSLVAKKIDKRNK